MEVFYVKLGGVDEYEKIIFNVKCFIIVVCGMFWYVGLIGEYFFEDFVCIFVEVEYVFELCYCNFII